MADDTWVEVVFCPPNSIEESSSFVAKTDVDGFLTAPESTYWRFNYVRWLDDDDQPLPNEADDGYGTDHYFFLKKSTVFRIEPIRGEYIQRWDQTIPEYDT